MWKRLILPKKWLKLTTNVFCTYIHDISIQTNLSGCTIKRGGGVKPSEPLRKKHFIFYYWKTLVVHNSRACVLHELWVCKFFRNMYEFFWYTDGTPVKSNMADFRVLMRHSCSSWYVLYDQPWSEIRMKFIRYSLEIYMWVNGSLNTKTSTVLFGATHINHWVVKIKYNLELIKQNLFRKYTWWLCWEQVLNMFTNLNLKYMTIINIHQGDVAS